MIIKIKLHQPLMDNDNIIGIDNSIVDIEEGLSIEALAKRLKLNPHAVVITVNKKIVPRERPLKEGDKVEIFPIVLGG